MKKREKTRATVIEVLYRAEIEEIRSEGNQVHVKFQGEDKLYIIPASILDKFAADRGW